MRLSRLFLAASLVLAIAACGTKSPLLTPQCAKTEKTDSDASTPADPSTSSTTCGKAAKKAKDPSEPPQPITR